MSNIFISYSHKDTEYAHALSKYLQDMGFRVWIDARLDYGSQWPQEIQTQLDNCDAFIIIMSPRSYMSDWVQSELQRAKRKSKPIFPLLLEGDEPWLSVESTQFFDVRGGKFPDSRFTSALERVVASGEGSDAPQASPGPVNLHPVSSSLPTKSRSGMVIAGIGAITLIFTVCVLAIGGWVIFSKFRNSTPEPVSGNCLDGYVYRLINPDDKVCVSQASKAQADADNAAAESRKIRNTYKENECVTGFVWREAFTGDDVCVTPDVREQAAADNAASASHWTAGDLGPETCISGYVWREASQDDHVCVTPDIREQTRADNAAAESRKAWNVYGKNDCIPGYVGRGAFEGDLVCVTPEVRNQTASDNASAPDHTQ